MTDTETQKAIHEYSEINDCVVVQRILFLHNCWPSKRTRWFALIIPRNCGLVGLDGLPELMPPPVLGDLFPSSPWPIWNFEDESQLRWTSMELQAFRCTDYGPSDRRLDMQSPCPTALHSWGSVLYKCPCGCRDKGISVTSLLHKGLRGFEVVPASGRMHQDTSTHGNSSSSWPSHHLMPFLSGCRAQLVLFENAASPVQVIWVVLQLLHCLGLTPHGKTPRELLAGYLTMIIKQRDLSWLPEGAWFQLAFSSLDFWTLDFPCLFFRAFLSCW